MTETLLSTTKIFSQQRITWIGLGKGLALDVLHDLDDNGAFQVHS
jgi:hypothetical protein